MRPERAPKGVFFLLLLCCVWASTGMANFAAAADEAVSSAARDRGKRFASVWRIRGDVVATDAKTGKARTLAKGDPVFVGERVRAQATGEAVLKTEDAGVLAVRPGAVFVVERFAAQGRPGDNFTVRLVVGALRVVTGWIGRNNRAAHRIVTPTATIGIRGTDHEPYVMTEELAQELSQSAGTYDKVNRGGTTLHAHGSEVDIDPGSVGFARAPESRRTRGLMTLLLPTLLDRIPDFYVPGQFEAEVDRLSQAAEEAVGARPSDRRSSPKRSAGAATAVGDDVSGVQTARSPAYSASAAGASTGVASDGACAANVVAKTWLAQMDAAIAGRQVRSLLGLFAPEVVVRANVRSHDATMTTLDLGREEFTQSLIAAVQGLSEYQQRRPSIEGRVVEAGICERISVKSVVIEQGKQKGKPYRFESTEEYILERRAGAWLATRATTTQR